MYDLLVSTMQAYVEQTWGWEDAYQQDRFRASFDPAMYEIIVVGGEEIGVVSFYRRDADFFLAEIQVSPDYQKKGLGTRVIQDLIAKGNREKIPVALQVLKVNPAHRLYERLGFHVVGETETHLQMRRPYQDVK